MNNKKYFKYIKRDFKKIVKSKNIKEVELIKKDICGWFENQYMLYKRYDKIKSTQIYKLFISKETFNRINYKKSYIIFKVELTDDNKNGLCKLSLNTICEGTFTLEDFRILKEVKIEK